MKANDFTYLLNNPTAVNEQQELLLDKIVAEFPYFQSARALQLKVLHNQNSFRYNHTLKVTAAHTTDRNVLFEFITSEDFAVHEDNLAENIAVENTAEETQSFSIDWFTNLFENRQEQAELTSEPETVSPDEENTVAETAETSPEGRTENKLELSILSSIREAAADNEKPSETETSTEEKTGSKLEESIISSINKAEPPAKEVDERQAVAETAADEEAEEKSPEEKLKIGQPLDFSKEEKHSFQEWLQLASLKPINRTEDQEAEIEAQEAQAAEPEVAEEEIQEPEATEEKSTEEDEQRKKKLALIDKFIEANPKITPAKNAPVSTFVLEQQPAIENSYLMTETLAKVYLEQKKYQKAIQAYEILILKYPEKISFFANRISDIKALQQNNN